MVVVKDEEVDAFKVQRASVIYQSRASVPTFNFAVVRMPRRVLFLVLP